MKPLKDKWQSKTKQDLTIEVWEALDCESVGRVELERIQQALIERFGEGASESPASIARTLADEGAVLRHPEVFEFDLQWRERIVSKQNLIAELEFFPLSNALVSFAKLEQKRHEIETGAGAKELDRLREIVRNAREYSLLAVRSKILSADDRQEAEEVSEWLAVWLRSPKLFPDWLDLRMRAPEFKKKFGAPD